MTTLLIIILAWPLVSLVFGLALGNLMSRRP
jgi:uncharacterized protein YneF (UPF0154 family)